MVQSWVMGSNSSAGTSVRSTASHRSRFSVSDKPAKGWRFARLLFFAFAFLVLFSGMTFMRSFASTERVEPAAGAEQVISVDTGDTLWTIAASLKQDTMDTREAVHQLMKRNGLKSSSLDSGQVLIVPETIVR